MSLSTYADLQAAVARWLTRDDLADVIPDFITLAEARLNDRLRLAPMEKVSGIDASSLASTAVIVDEATGAILTDEESGAWLTDEEDVFGLRTVIDMAPLPADFLEMRMLIGNTYPKSVIKLMSPGWATYTYDGLSGYPRVYTIIGSTLAVHPSTSASLSMTYYARIPSLSDVAPTNWLLTRYPNMYLYASLLEAVPLLQDDGRVALWKGALDEAISDARQSDIGTRWSNSGFRLSGPTP